uniref:Odorant receptor n=1 Tax=Heterorhabditis bacteriophora TaxID=37862 RepID=A0A1I7WH07_HETBA
MKDAFKDIKGGVAKRSGRSKYYVFCIFMWEFVGTFSDSIMIIMTKTPNTVIFYIAGYRMFDTAKYYKNEVELGEALQVGIYKFIFSKKTYCIFVFRYFKGLSINEDLRNMSFLFLYVKIKIAFLNMVHELLPKYNLLRSDVFLVTKFFPDHNDPAKAARELVIESLVYFKILEIFVVSFYYYIDMVLIHYPKAEACELDDPRNADHRKYTYLALEQLKGILTSIIIFLYFYISYINLFFTLIFPVFSRRNDSFCIRKGYTNLLIKKIIRSVTSWFSGIILLYFKDMPCANQVEYHPHFVRDELKEYCNKEGIFFQVILLLSLVCD